MSLYYKLKEKVRTLKGYGYAVLLFLTPLWIYRPHCLFPSLLSEYILNLRALFLAVTSVLNADPWTVTAVCYTSFGEDRVSPLTRYPKDGDFLYLEFHPHIHMYTHVQCIVCVRCTRPLFHHGSSECTLHKVREIKCVWISCPDSTQSRHTNATIKAHPRWLIPNM